MSRLDPLRERQYFLDALGAQREQDLQNEMKRREPHRVSPQGHERSAQQKPSVEVSGRETPFQDSRGVLYDRDRGYRLRQSEIHMLSDLGKFRVIAVEDLVVHVYDGKFQEMREDLRNLLRQGLVLEDTFDGPEANPRLLLALTKPGHRLLHANRILPREQVLYHGVVRPREANHDVNLYKLYQKEWARIAKLGGRNPRVILDYEFKLKINRQIAQLGRDARPEIARAQGLHVVRGRIPVPDIRIEYESVTGDLARVDLELVTEHYRFRAVADKVKAGFFLYTPRGEADRLRRVLDQQELTAEILSL
jgi:hypothetical protein